MCVAEPLMRLGRLLLNIAVAFEAPEIGRNRYSSGELTGNWGMVPFVPSLAARP